MHLLNFKTPFHNFINTERIVSPPPILLLHFNSWGWGSHLVIIFVNQKYDLSHEKCGHILNQTEMQIKVLRKTVLEEYLTETVFDIQNFPRNLSARVLGWPFFQLSNTAQLTQGGANPAGSGAERHAVLPAGSPLCSRESRTSPRARNTRPDFLPSKPGAETFPFSREGGKGSLSWPPKEKIISPGKSHPKGPPEQ